MPPPRIVLLSVGWVLLLVTGAYLISPASILTVVMADLAISEGLAAALVSVPQVSATLLGLPVGIYLDRIETRAAVPAAGGLLCLGSIGDWVAASAGDVRLLILSRLVAGVGMFTIWVVGTNAVSGVFPAERRATATSVFITGYPAGYAFGQIVSPLIAETAGWPFVFPVFGIAVVLASLGFYLAARRIPRLEKSGERPDGLAIRRVIGSRNVWGVAVLSFLVYSLYMVFNSWMPTYLSQRFGVPLVESGLFVAVFPAVGVLSRPAGGWLSDGLFDRRRRPVFAIAFVGAAALAIAMRYSRTVSLLLVGLAVAGFFVQFPIGVLYQYVQEFVETNVAGTAISLVSVCGWLGTFVAPVLVGELIATSGDIGVTFEVAVALGVTGLVAVWAIAESGTGSTSV